MNQPRVCDNCGKYHEDELCSNVRTTPRMTAPGQVRIVCCGDGDIFWVKAVLYGRDLGMSVPVEGVEAFSVMEDRLTKLANAIYERGIDDGKKIARGAMRAAIGF